MLFGVDQRGPEVDFLIEYLEEKDLNIEDRNLVALRETALTSIEKSQKYSQKWFE